mgnify:CR=1 FL=1
MQESKGNLIGGRWSAGSGAAFEASDPATGAAYWSGHESSAEEVAQAVDAARAALPAWAGLSQEQRRAVLERYREAFDLRKPEATAVISQETGKPRWEAATEAGAIVGKVGLTFEAFAKRRGEESFAMGDAKAYAFKPTDSGKPQTRGFRHFMLGFIRRTLWARISGGWRKTPLFDDTGAPTAQVLVLSRDDRAKVAP